MRQSSPRKPNGYWNKENTLIEARRVLEKHGEEALSRNWLAQNGYSSLSQKITEHFGYQDVRARLDLAEEPERKVVWTKEKTLNEARELYNKHGSNALISTWLRDHGHSSLSSHISKYFGFPEIRRLLCIDQPRMPRGSWTVEAILSKAKEIAELKGSSALTQAWLKQNGYGDLQAAIDNSTPGISWIREELGLKVNKRGNNYWNRETIHKKAKEIVALHGEEALTTEWLKENGHGSMLYASYRIGGLSRLREELKIDTNRKKPGFWNRDSVVNEARRVLEVNGPGSLTPSWLITNGHASLNKYIGQNGGFDWIRSALGVETSSIRRKQTGPMHRRKANLEELRNILRDLSLEGVWGFTPAQLIVLFQQAKFDKLPFEEGRDLYIYLTQGLLMPQELFEWSFSEEPEPTLINADPEPGGAPVPLGGVNRCQQMKTIEEGANELVHEHNGDGNNNIVSHCDLDILETEEGLPSLALMDPSDQLRFLDSEIFAAADDEAIEALISISLHQLWAKAYLGEEHVAHVVEACQQFHPKRPWSRRLQTLFLEQFKKATVLPLPQGFNYKVDGLLVEPRLMQRHVAAQALERRRQLVMSDMGTGKSLASQLAVMADGAERVLVIAINSCVEQWVYDFKERWDGNNVRLLNMDTIRTLTAVSGQAKPDNKRAVWVIPSHLLSLMKDQEVGAVVAGLEPDAVILDEIHIFKQREEADESKRRQQTLKLLTAASDMNPEMMVLGLSGTVITNSLNEGRTLLELVMGEERPDLPTGRGIAKAMRMHQALMANGIRQRATNDFPYVIERPEVDATDWLEDVQLALRYPPRLRPLQVEKALIHARIPAIIEAINGPTVVVTQYVEGFIEPMRKAIKAAGHRVGVHTGDEKLPVHGHPNAVEAFKAGELDVLLASINTISTGVDGLQSISNNLVIACMPWTAADYLQVIARLARSGQEQPVRVVIPTTHINYVDDELGPAQWSFCTYRASIIACKQRLMDAVMDGLVPESEEITEAKAGQQLVKWLERLNTKGALVRPSRPIRVPLVFDTEEEETKARARFGSWSSCNGRWNSQASDKLHKRLQANPQEWELYHTDLDSLRKEWDVDPLQEAINHCLKSQGLVIGDFGCGTARLAEEMQGRHVVHSFDHVAINDKVISCDIGSGVPLPDGSLDLAIFSLSLMGPNWRDQLVEARRCLKPTGQVLIWSAASGKDAAEFSKLVESTGFKVVTTQCHYKWLHVWAVCV